MMHLAFMFAGGLIGLGCRHYCRHFGEKVAKEIYLCYSEIFPDEPPNYTTQKSLLQPIKCGSNLECFVGFATLFFCCALLFGPSLLAAIIGVKCSLLAIISLLDFNYRLIPTALCQQLMTLGVLASYAQLLPQPLEETLLSGAIGFVLFWLFYHLATLLYQKEAFGRGDYWLLGGLACFHPWQALPQLIFTACVSALIYATWKKWRKQPVQFIPFAPFLCFGGLLTFGLNWWH